MNQNQLDREANCSKDS